MSAINDADVAAIQDTLAHAYDSADTAPVMVLDGYGITLSVQNGELVAADGIGQHRRERRLSKHQRRVRRIIILSRAGTVTLAALRWCTDTGISVAQIDPDGVMVASTAVPNPKDARLRRAQAAAAGTATGLAISQSLLDAKLAGHETILDTRLRSPDRATALRMYRKEMAMARTIEGLREIEARAANLYFAGWSGIAAATFATREVRRVPNHWNYPAVRKSPLEAGRSARKAIDPVNAMLNYAYTLGEIECRRACIILGLDPALGVMHADKAHRDSLALDILEPLRPVIEVSLLDMMSLRRFRKVDFIETPQGQCRLTESVTHALTEYVPSWAQTLAPIAESVAHALTRSAIGSLTIRTPLTQGQRRSNYAAARRRRNGPVKTPGPATVKTCRDCGKPLENNQRLLCAQCWPVERSRLAAQRAQRGQMSLSAARRAGKDPTQTTEARERRKASQRAERAVREAWNKAHPGHVADRDAFLREIVPGLADIPLSGIMDAIGVTSSAASRIRRGALIPHARHWDKLVTLAGKNHRNH